MDNEIRETVNSLCTIVKAIDGRVSDIKTEIVNNKEDYQEDINKLRIDITRLGVISTSLTELVLIQDEKTDKAMLFICGAFSGMGYHEVTEGLRAIYKFEPKE